MGARRLNRGRRALTAAELAVERLGGRSSAAAAVTAATGEECTVHIVAGWLRNGVGARWTQAVAELTGLPASELTPEVFGRREVA